MQKSKLRNKILVPVVAITLLGQLALGLFTYTSSQRASVELLKDNARSISKIISGNIDQWINSRRNQIEIWAKSSRYKTATANTFIGKAAKRSSTKQLVKIIKSYPMYLNISIIDGSGKIIVSTNESMLDKDFKNSALFTTTQKGQFYLSKIQRSDSGQPVFEMSAAIQDKKETVGVLFATVDFSYFDKTTLNIAGEQTAQDIFILDESGQYIAHKDSKMIMNPKTSELQYVKDILAKKNGDLQFETQNNQRFASFQEYQARNWIVGIKVNQDVILKGAKESTNINVILAAIMVIVMISILIIVTQFQVEKPIHSLISTTKAICEGKLDTKISINRTDELGVLAQDFSTMRDAIKQKIDEIEEYNRTLEDKVEERTQEVKEKSDYIMNILKNIHLGILTVTDEAKVHTEYSDFLEKILGHQNIAGRNIVDVLFSKSTLAANDISQCYEALRASLNSHGFVFDINGHLLILEAKIDVDGEEKILEFQWSPVIGDNNTLQRIIVSVRDVTEIRKFQNQAAEKQRQINIIGQLLPIDQESFREFTKQINNVIDLLTITNMGKKYFNQEEIEIIYRDLHTLKGVCRTWGLSFLVDKVHLAEEPFFKVARNHDNTQIPVEDTANLVREIQDTFEEYKNIYKTLEDRNSGISNAYPNLLDATYDLVLEIEANQNKPHRDAKTLELFELIKSSKKNLSYNNFKSQIERIISKTIRNQTTKPKPVIHYEFNEINLANYDLKPLFNAMLHVVANSLDHGIEPPAERQKNNKEETGNLYFEFLEENGLHLKVYDDGRGIDLKKVKVKASERQLLDNDKDYTPAEIAELIFHTGFSTRDIVSETSGRGAGMGALRAEIEKTGGKVSIEFVDKDVGVDETSPIFLKIFVPLMKNKKLAA